MVYKDLELIEKLEKRLQWYQEEASEEEFDADDVDAICTMLQKLAPEKYVVPDKKQAYEKLMERIREEETGGESSNEGIILPFGEHKEKENNADISSKIMEKANRRKIRAAVFWGISIITTALLTMDLTTYARGEKSLFRMFLEKAGVVRIEREKEEKSTIIYEGLESEKIYDSWSELDSEIKQKIVVPEYIPEGFSLYNIKTYKTNNRIKVLADYYNLSNKHVKININLWENKNEMEAYKGNMLDEKKCILIPEYSDTNALCYQYDDEYVYLIFLDKCIYSIYGEINLEEMVKIRSGLN